MQNLQYTKTCKNDVFKSMQCVNKPAIYQNMYNGKPAEHKTSNTNMSNTGMRP